MSDHTCVNGDHTCVNGDPTCVKRGHTGVRCGLIHYNRDHTRVDRDHTSVTRNHTGVNGPAERPIQVCSSEVADFLADRFGRTNQRRPSSVTLMRYCRVESFRRSIVPNALQK